MRDDLAATMAPLWRSLLAEERRIAAEFDLSMWGYAALHQLADQPVRTQVALASALGLDKTRLISVLDDLQARSFIHREPDPEDRRVRVLSLTPAGRRLFSRVQQAVHRSEDELLAEIPDRDRAAFLATLRSLSAAATERCRSTPEPA